MPNVLYAVYQTIGLYLPESEAITPFNCFNSPIKTNYDQKNKNILVHCAQRVYADVLSR